MGFHEVRFPANLSFGSIGGPERRTDVVTLANGFEERNTPWAHSRRRYDAGIGMRSLDDIETLIAFFEARRGQMYAFRWKDWSDYRSGPPGAASRLADAIGACWPGDGAADPDARPAVSAPARGDPDGVAAWLREGGERVPWCASPCSTSMTATRRGRSSWRRLWIMAA